MIFLIFCFITFYISLSLITTYTMRDIMNFLPLKKGTTSALAFLKLVMRNFVDTALTTEDDGRRIADS